MVPNLSSFLNFNVPMIQGDKDPRSQWTLNARIATLRVKSIQCKYVYLQRRDRMIDGDTGQRERERERERV